MEKETKRRTKTKKETDELTWLNILDGFIIFGLLVFILMLFAYPDNILFNAIKMVWGVLT